MQMFLRGNESQVLCKASINGRLPNKLTTVCSFTSALGNRQCNRRAWMRSAERRTSGLVETTRGERTEIGVNGHGHERIQLSDR